jgi:hypothetical protein
MAVDDEEEDLIRANEGIKNGNIVKSNDGDNDNLIDEEEMLQENFMNKMKDLVTKVAEEDELMNASDDSDVDDHSESDNEDDNDEEKLLLKERKRAMKLLEKKQAQEFKEKSDMRRWQRRQEEKKRKLEIELNDNISNNIVSNIVPSISQSTSNSLVEITAKAIAIHQNIIRTTSGVQRNISSNLTEDNNMDFNKMSKSDEINDINNLNSNNDNHKVKRIKSTPHKLDINAIKNNRLNNRNIHRSLTDGINNGGIVNNSRFVPLSTQNNSNYSEFNVEHSLQSSQLPDSYTTTKLVRSQSTSIFGQIANNNNLVNKNKTLSSNLLHSGGNGNSNNLNIMNSKSLYHGLLDSSVLDQGYGLGMSMAPQALRQRKLEMV